MNRQERVALLQKIRQTINVYDVMRQLGDWEGPEVTKQLKCPFHGADRKPSARVYKDSGVMYCYVCQNHRYDAVRYVQCHENIPFWDAVDKIRDWFGIKVEVAEDDFSYLFEDEKVVAPKLFEKAERALLQMRGVLDFSEYLRQSNYLDQIEDSLRDEGVSRSVIEDEVNKFCAKLRKVTSGPQT